MDETNETASQSEPQTESKTEPKRRVRLMSPRKQLQVTLQRMEKLAQSNTLRESKLADLLLSMGDLQKMLLKLTTDEETEKLEAEHDALIAQHALSVQRVQELEAENARLRNHRCEVRVERLADPEAAALREQNSSLRSALEALVKPLDTDARARLAVQVVSQSSESAARAVCSLIQVDYALYRRLLNEYDEQRCLELVEGANEYNQMGNLIVFARACLSVVHGVNVVKPKKKEFDPAIFGRLENRLAEIRAQKAALEAQRAH